MVRKSKVVDEKTVHIWMPDGRSLCDRRAQMRMASYESADFDASVDEEVTAPICGPCIIIASHIRTMAGALLAQGRAEGRPVFPEVPSDAYVLLLQDTRWALQFSPDPPDELQKASYYDESIFKPYSEKWIENAATEALENARVRRENLLAQRDASLAQLPETTKKPPP